MDANWGLNGEDSTALWQKWEMDNEEGDLLATEGGEDGNSGPPRMKEGDVDANWGLNGEDSTALWQKWEMDNKEGDRLATEGGEDGNSGPPRMKEVLIKVSDPFVFAKPQLPGISNMMTRGQVNEMCWAIRHIVPKKEVGKKQSQLTSEKTREITSGFWLKYMKAMRVVDKGSAVTPLSTFSPGALQRVWEKKIAPKCTKLSTEVYGLNFYRMKLEVGKANKEKFNIIK